jgi:hypothetical protein
MPLWRKPGTRNHRLEKQAQSTPYSACLPACLLLCLSTFTRREGHLQTHTAHQPASQRTPCGTRCAGFRCILLIALRHDVSICLRETVCALSALFLLRCISFYTAPSLLYRLCPPPPASQFKYYHLHREPLAVQRTYSLAKFMLFAFECCLIAGAKYPVNYFPSI